MKPRGKKYSAIALIVFCEIPFMVFDEEPVNQMAVIYIKRMTSWG